MDSPRRRPSGACERIELLRYALKRDALVLVHYGTCERTARVGLYLPPQSRPNSSHNQLIEDAREMLEVRGLHTLSPQPVPPHYRFVPECEPLVALADLINTLVLLASHQGCTHALLPQAAVAQRGGRAARAGFPLYDMGFDLPDPICELSPHSRAARCVLTRELCVLDRERLFVQGALSLPVQGAMRPFRLGLWAEVHPGDAEILCAWRCGTGSELLVCVAGEIANRLSLVPTTTGMAVRVRLERGARIAQLSLPSSGHPLSVEERDGLSSARFGEYSATRH